MPGTRIVRTTTPVRAWIASVWLALVLAAPATEAYEPVTALDDAFAIPMPGRLAESAPAFPGVESLIGHEYALVAWQSPFGIDELAVSTAHAGVVFGPFGLSGTFAASGFDLYGEELLRLGLSYAPFNGLGAGVRLSRPGMRIQGFGSAAVMTIDAGIVWRPGEEMLIAGSLEDIGNGELGESKEPVDGAAKLAASWRANEMFTLFAGVRNVPRYDASVTAGFTARIAGPLTLGAAGGSEPDRFEYLAEITLGGLRFGYRGACHPELGTTYGCSLVWGGWHGTESD